MSNSRQDAIQWWRAKDTLEQQQLIEQHKTLIVGGTNRHPDTLTGREIETIYSFITQ